MNLKLLSNLILIAYALMMIVSLVSAVDLFTLSHPALMFGWMMSVAIEISIAALLMINRGDAAIKSALYVLGFITMFQICANTYSAYIHITDIKPFAELFALDDWEVIDQKRILAFATGGLLPAICLSLIYIQSEVRNNIENDKKDNTADRTAEPEPEQQENEGSAGKDTDADMSASGETVESFEQKEAGTERELFENQQHTSEQYTEHQAEQPRPEESSSDLAQHNEDSSEDENITTESEPKVEAETVAETLIETDKPKAKKTAKKSSKKNKKTKYAKSKSKTSKSKTKSKNVESDQNNDTASDEPDEAEPIPESIDPIAAESVEKLSNDAELDKHKHSTSTVDSFVSMF